MSDIKETLNEREKTHGNFVKHAQHAQQLKESMYQTDNWDLLSPDKREALEMIQHKIARILNGNSSHKDHWHDIAGYATLIEKELPY